MRLSGNFKKNWKIFSQFLVLKDRFFKDRSFFYATFLNFVFTEAPAQFLQETKRFARGLLKALRLTGDHQKCFRKILKFFSSIFCLRFSVEKEWCFLLFSVGEEWFSRLTRIPSGIFWRCKIDEILISFYPWFSVWNCLFGFLQKFASVCEARLRLCVKKCLPVDCIVAGLSSLLVFFCYWYSGWYGVPYFRCRPRVCVFSPPTRWYTWHLIDDEDPWYLIEEKI